MSEFDQVDSRKDQAPDDDVSPKQCDEFRACHRVGSASITARRCGDPDCLDPLIEPISPRACPDWAQRRNVRPPSYDKKIGLVMQGGGALGSYQAGVYEALASSEYLPDWVAGISIGAINAAIIAGNTPENRVKRLRSFWEEVTAQHNFLPSAPVGSLAKWQPRSSALTALMFGQPGFFTPRAPKDWLSPGNLLSYYDTSFNRINRTDDMRLRVGAVNVRSGRRVAMRLRRRRAIASSRPFRSVDRRRPFAPGCL
jgi:predicted acylesterase/phospholipase RssA